MTRFAKTKYQALYLINNGSYITSEGIDTAWDYQFDNDKQTYTYMLASQKNNFEEVKILIDDVTENTVSGKAKNGYHYKRNKKSSYEWNKLPAKYVSMINKRYHIYTDRGVINQGNYESIIAYADMIQYLVENYSDIEVDSHGEFKIKLPLREKLTNYSRDIILSNDGSGYVLNCKSLNDNNRPEDTFTVDLDDIPEIIRKAEAYDRLKESLELFVTRV